MNTRLKRRKPQKLGIRKQPQERNPSHLRYVRGFECAIAGKSGHECSERIEAAHVRMGTDGGIGVKPSDRFTIPLCSAAHRLQHDVGEIAFQQRYGINMLELAEDLYRRSPHRRDE